MPSEKRENEPPQGGQPPQGGLPMFNRLARAGSGGLAAATIGWTLALCIVGGALAGLALDNKLGTKYWTPILFLLGVAAGFIQMVRTLNDANRLEAREAAAKRAEQQNSVAAKKPTRGEEWIAAQDVTEPERAPSRPSRIPPPPTASFDAASTGTQTAPRELPQDISDDLTQLRKMLAEERAEDENE